MWTKVVLVASLFLVACTDSAIDAETPETEATPVESAPPIRVPTSPPPRGPAPLQPSPEPPADEAPANQIEVRGSLDREVIRRAVHQHHVETSACFQSGADAPMGTVRMRFIVNPTGAVQAAIATQVPQGMRGVADCLVRHVEDFRFPSPAGGGVVIVTWPFAYPH